MTFLEEHDIMHQSTGTPAPWPPRLGGEFNIGHVLKHR